MLKQLKSTLLSSGFNECILLFSDLPDIEIETCVIASQKMYLKTPKSITYRKNVMHNSKASSFVSNPIAIVYFRIEITFLRRLLQDVSNLELTDLQKEMCPRISAADLGKLLTKSPNEIAVIDLRSSIE